jgi:hypothetical protein
LNGDPARRSDSDQSCGYQWEVHAFKKSWL